MAEATNIDMGYALDLAPAEAVAYFRSKGFAISDDWRDLWQAAQARSFTVARMSKFDLLADTRKIVDATIADGRTLQQAAKELEAAMRRHGWWGKETRPDGPGGVPRTVQLGSPHRIKTILRTNIGTAYSAGRYQRQRQVMDSRPYWEYTAVRDRVTRKSHLQLHGLVFRADDPIWNTIYPPNGFSCRCRVRALTQREVDRRKLKINADTSTQVIQVINDRTTRVSWQAPDGDRSNFTPDKGWAYNPGQHALPPPNPRNARAVPGQPTWQDYNRPRARDLPPAPAPPLLGEASTPAEARAIKDAALGLSEATPRRFVQTPTGQVLLQRERTDYIVDRPASSREQFANRIIPTLETPNEVWMTYYDTGEFRQHFIKIFDDDRNGFSVVTETKDGGLLYNFFPTSRENDLNNRRVGVLFYPQEGRE